MNNFQIIKDFNQIKLSQDWVDTSQRLERIVEKDGRQYRVIEKERTLSFSERLERCFLGTLASIRSLDITLLLAPLWELFSGVKETARFGILVKSIKVVEPAKENINDNEQLKVRAGISNYKASSCYLSSTFQALAALKDRTLLTQGNDLVSQFFKRVFSLLDSGKKVAVATTKKLVEEAYALKLTGDYIPGVHGDPEVVLKNLLLGRASGLYTVRRGNDIPMSYCTILQSKEISAGTSLQDIIDGKTGAKNPVVVQDKASAPSFFALNVGGRCRNWGYDSKNILTPHKLMVDSRDGQKVPYNLSSVVIFLGEKSEGANHYYTYERINDTTWMKYNDSVVEKIVDADRKIQNLVEQRGYLLFYSKE